MVPDDPLTHGQADAGALVAGLAVEALAEVEDALVVLGVEADAVVLDAESSRCS